ncbi:hypothetical protein MSG28_003095 [Choristoneura fumiferana]|uniref:Uncharacterized protein n=1 Tax=Choristoneura fumiferana TaxID=7141 RepID=A0ACC0KDI6_CHOFU|nr:hypothetical protein MSG28_003095 [Choristoneura fumiferana]
MSDDGHVEIRDLETEKQDLLISNFKGHPAGFARFGQAGYLMPQNFRAHAQALRAMTTRPDDAWVVTFPRTAYIRPLLGTGLLSEQEGLGHSSHAGPVRIGNFTRTIELLRRHGEHRRAVASHGEGRQLATAASNGEGRLPATAASNGEKCQAAASQCPPLRLANGEGRLRRDQRRGSISATVKLRRASARRCGEMWREMPSSG